MKIILSRKGFDGEYGGFASPILPDGRMISIPIPEQSSGIKYSDLVLDNTVSYSLLMQGLMGEKIKLSKQRLLLDAETCCHLDPDIAENIVSRPNEWRGAFGQIDGSATHLKNQGVDVGDLFLFFGWFRKTVLKNNKITYDRADKDGRHVLFGYLQVGEIIEPRKTTFGYEWLHKHPHFLDNRVENATNTIYLSAQSLSFASQLAGYGTFRFSPELILSKEGESKSKWALPEFFKKVDISCHTKEAWKDGYFQSTAPGQEFVIEATNEIKEWAYGIITENVLLTTK